MTSPFTLKQQAYHRSRMSKEDYRLYYQRQYYYANKEKMLERTKLYARRKKYELNDTRPQHWKVTLETERPIKKDAFTPSDLIRMESMDKLAQTINGIMAGDYIFSFEKRTEKNY